MLVGRSRVELVERIEASFAEVCSSSSPRMWVLTAPSGSGKTRVVQELYAALAARQPGPAAYWPPSIVDAALQVRSNLAYCLWQAGRTAEALTMYRELLPDAQRTLAAGHPLVGQTIQNIATLSDR